MVAEDQDLWASCGLSTPAPSEGSALLRLARERDATHARHMAHGWGV